MSLKLICLTFLAIVLTLGDALASECFSPEISLTQKIEHEGFHRELHWLLEGTPNANWNKTRCTMALMLQASKEMFFNPDEIADLNRAGLLQTYIEGDVNIEVAAHMATRHVIYIYVTNAFEKTSIDVPFHLRYQRAQIAGGFGKVPVHKPSILVQCPGVCGNGDIEAPCDFSGGDKCIWKNVTYKALFDAVELAVPVGDLDDYPLVLFVTLLLGCAGCIYTLSVLSTTHL